MYRKNLAILAACSLAALLTSSSAFAADCDTAIVKHHHVRTTSGHVHHVKRPVKASARASVTHARGSAKSANSLTATQYRVVKHGCPAAQADAGRDCVCPDQANSAVSPNLRADEWERLQ